MSENSQDQQLLDPEQARREFMKAAGKLALYTPPAMLMLMKPSTSAIAASAGISTTTDAVESSHHSFWLWRLLGLEE